MKKGFYTIMAAQFFSSLADNALLVAAIELLKSSNAPRTVLIIMCLAENPTRLWELSKVQVLIVSSLSVATRHSGRR